MMKSISKKIGSTVQSWFPYKRKKKIQDWDFIMVFDLLVEQQITVYFKGLDCLKNVKFQFIQYKQTSSLLVLIAMDQHITIDQAHQLKILKIKQKRSFQFSAGSVSELILKAQKQKSLHYVSYLHFIQSRLQPRNHLIYQQQKYSVFNKHKKDKYPSNDKYSSKDQQPSKSQLFTPQQQLRCKYNYLLSYNENLQHQKTGDCVRFPFIDIMRKDSFRELVPVHKNSRYRPIVFGSIKSYIGSNEDTYFQFVKFMQSWLIFPALIGLLTTLFNYFFQYTADDSPGDFIYSLIIMFWSIYFITNWENQSKWLKTKQSSGYNDQLWSQHQDILLKDGLSKRTSLISGKLEYYLPFKQKMFYHFISIGTCVLLSIGSIFFMILSLNARGFVDPDHKLLYFETISQWAATGGIFDANTWYGQIPNLIHVIVTNGFDQSVYRPLAKKLTKIQRHLNSKTHSDSIIIKYFVYEFIITFADFFYIAFVRFDIEGLRQQLLSLFFIDIVRRLIAQAFIPWLKNKYFAHLLKGDAKQVTAQNQLRHYAIIQVNKQKFQSFDDYLQIITNFGYLVLISSCFPLAPLLIILAHSIQTLQDKYKLIHIFRRKLPQKFVGMGYWKDIIVFLCYMSIVTNILLFAFSSKQIVGIFPMLFEGTKDLVRGDVGITDLFTGAATGVLSAMITLGNTTIETVARPFQFLTNFTLDANQNLLANDTMNSTSDWFSNISSDSNLNDLWMTPQVCETTQSPISLTTYVPVPKQHQIQFIGILFLLEHTFLIGFILLRKILSKRKTISDIFLERRAYKRRIKKYLSKDILADTLRDQVVSQLIGGGKDNEQNLLTKLPSRTSTMDSQNVENKQNADEGDSFANIIQRLADKAEKVIAINGKQEQQQNNQSVQNQNKQLLKKQA